MNDRLATNAAQTRGRAIAAYAAGALSREYPPAVIKAATTALVDYIGVAVGAVDEAPVRPVRAVAEDWAARGNARIFLGPLTTPPLPSRIRQSYN